MSNAGKWSYTETLTVWPKSSAGRYGESGFGAPYTLVGSWQNGTDLARDPQGNEFVPNSVFHFELDRDADPQPKVEDFVVLGDETASALPTDSAEEIRQVIAWGAEMFGAGQLPDWKLMT